MNLSMLAGPAIGAVIGYFTNYIAVKMLFRPLYPVKIGNYTLPFTPGIIPKGRERLARALGNAVGNTLFTKEDMEKALLSDDVIHSLDSLVDSLYEESGVSVKSLALSYTEEETYEDKKELLADRITGLLMEEIEKLPIGQWVAEKGTEAVLAHLDGLLAMMISAEMVKSLVTPAGQKIEDYIKEDGEAMIRPVVRDKMNSMEEESIGNLLSEIGLSSDSLKAGIRSIYQSFVEEKMTDLLEKINISKIVEDKINKMPIEDIESLVLSIMKKELGAVVNLGAVIGFLIGILNVFI